MNRTQYTGYARYPNTGRVFRAWEILQPVPAIGAVAGDVLRDVGPDNPERFRLAKKGEDFERRGISEEAVAELLAGTVPPWEPNAMEHGEATQALRDAIALANSMCILARASLDGKKEPARAATAREEKNVEGFTRGVYVAPWTGKWGDKVLIAVSGAGAIVREQVISEDAHPGEEASLASELWRELDRLDPPPAPLPPSFANPPEADAAMVERLLTDEDARPPRERSAHALLGWKGYHKTGCAVRRVRQRFADEVKEQGKLCEDCSERYKPRRYDQRRCPACVAARKKGRQG